MQALSAARSAIEEFRMCRHLNRHLILGTVLGVALIRGVARTAVIAGTASAVVGATSGKKQAQRN